MNSLKSRDSHKLQIVCFVNKSLLIIVVLVLVFLLVTVKHQIVINITAYPPPSTHASQLLALMLPPMKATPKNEF